MIERKLNIDIAGAISEFDAAAKEFELKEKIYKILFRGKGLEFESYREYSPEDDAEEIDWKASMRGGKILVKRYIEERDLGIVFMIDVSENMVLGSHEKLKCEYAAELIGALAHLILNSNDKIGFMFFSDIFEKSTSNFSISNIPEVVLLIVGAVDELLPPPPPPLGELLVTLTVKLLLAELLVYPT